MYQGSGSGQDNECDNCGAQLPMADGSGVRTCTFCKAVYATPVPTMAPPQVNVVFNAPGFTTLPDTEFSPVNPQKAKRGCGCGGLLTLLFILATIAVPLYFGLREAGIGNPFKPSYTFGENSIVLPGEPTAPPNFLTTTSHYGDGKTQVEVVRFNGVDGSAQWTTPTIPDGAIDVPLLTDAKHVYAFAKTSVYAYKLTDGTLAWQGSLTDEIENFQGCGCAVVGDLVIAKAKDGEVTAFDGATGKKAWTRTLVQTSSDLVHTKTALVVIDGEPGKSVATVVDLATGLDAKVMDPICQPPEDTSPTHAGSSGVWKQDPTGDGLIVFFDSSPGCIQGWDPVAGAMTWNVFFDDRSSFDDEIALFPTPAGLITADRSSLGLIGPEHTTFTDLLPGGEVQYYPVGLEGPTLIVEAKSTRGTTKTSIQGIDLATGAKKWEASLGKAQSINLDSSSSWSVGSDGTFMAHVDNGKVYVVTMKDNSAYNHTIFVDVLDVATGAAAPQKQFGSGSHDLIPAFGPGHWRGSKLLTRIGDDTMQVIDAATGEVVYKAP